MPTTACTSYYTTVVKGYVSEYRYYLMRDDNNDGNWHIVDSVPSDPIAHAYTDPDYDSFKNIATWRIQTIFEMGCVDKAPLYSNILPVRNIVSSVNENQLLSSILIGPNPASTQLSISSSASQLSAFEIYNGVGALVYKSGPVSNNRSTVDVALFNDGVYFIKLITSKGMVSKKFIIQK